MHAPKPEYSPAHIVENYDWGSLGNARVVDIGGGQGHIAMELARHFGNIDIVVQDMKDVVEKASVELPDHLRGKVQFMAHDFFTPQPIIADVYFLRWVLRNWFDKELLCSHSEGPNPVSFF